MTVPDMEINLLRAFVTVAERGSFTAAASVLGRSQSAVSQKISRLESIIGRPVFQRGSRSLTLTATGERLLGAARSLVEDSDQLLRSLRGPAATGQFRLGICEDFLPGQLPHLLARFAIRYDGVEIDLATGLSCKLIDDYETGRYDAIVVKRTAKTHSGRTIWREPLAWMAPLNYVDEAADPVRLVMLPTPCSYRDLMIQTLNDAGRGWIGSCTTSSLTGAQAAVAGGFGVTVLGRSFLREDMQLLNDPKLWPSLPPLEIAVVGAQTKTSEIADTLTDFLVESLPNQQPMVPIT